MQNTRTILNYLILSINVSILSLASCSEETTITLDDSNDSSESSTFVPIFDYNIYGSGLTYDTQNKLFSYTFFFENKGNIGIFIDIDTRNVDYDDVFEIGIYTTNGFESYSKELQKNEFRFGEGKVGHEIRPDNVITVEIMGIVDGEYNFSPNAVRLHNLYIISLTPEFKESIDIILLD